MTKEQFKSIGWNRNCIVRDDYPHEGHVNSVNFEYGVIHWEDDFKKCSFGKHYSQLEFVRYDNE